MVGIWPDRCNHFNSLSDVVDVESGLPHPRVVNLELLGVGWVNGGILVDDKLDLFDDLLGGEIAPLFEFCGCTKLAPDGASAHHANADHPPFRSVSKVVVVEAVLLAADCVFCIKRQPSVRGFYRITVFGV